MKFKKEITLQEGGDATSLRFEKLSEFPPLKCEQLRENEGRKSLWDDHCEE
jgi:hypothetical protein